MIYNAIYMFSMCLCRSLFERSILLRSPMLNARPVNHCYFLVRYHCPEDGTFKTPACFPTYRQIIIEICHFLKLHRLESLSIIRFDSEWSRINYRRLTSFLPAIHWVPPSLRVTRNRSYVTPAVHSTDFKQCISESVYYVKGY